MEVDGSSFALVRVLDATDDPGVSRGEAGKCRCKRSSGLIFSSGYKDD